MTDLAHLIERLEKAVEPDRRIDAELACAMIFIQLRPAEPFDFDGRFTYEPGNIKCEHGFLMSDHFTASIDAALSLVEKKLPGWTYTVDASAPESGIDFDLFPPGRADKCSVTAKSLPLAILIALLRALQEKAE